MTGHDSNNNNNNNNNNNEKNNDCNKCATLMDKIENEQINFQEIKHKGPPYFCPFDLNYSFPEWSQWKYHWYQHHNNEYNKLSQKQGVYNVKSISFVSQ